MYLFMNNEYIYTYIYMNTIYLSNPAPVSGQISVKGIHMYLCIHVFIYEYLNTNKCYMNEDIYTYLNEHFFLSNPASISG
jgi:hypothetical protein